MCDYMRLPDIEKPTKNAADNQEDEGKKSGSSPVRSGEVVDSLHKFAGDEDKVFMQHGYQDGCDSCPNVQPEPVLYLARQTTHKTTPQRVRASNQNDDI